jgi:hypothetical protein
MPRVIHDEVAGSPPRPTRFRFASKATAGVKMRSVADCQEPTSQPHKGGHQSHAGTRPFTAFANDS